MKEAKKVARLFLYMIVGLPICLLFRNLALNIYNLLYSHFPSVFPLYSVITDKRSYEVFYSLICGISLFCALLLIVYITQIFSNDRMEYIISKTNGFYKIHEMLKSYIYIFALGDALSSAVCGLLFSVPIYFIPKQFFGDDSLLCSMLLSFRALTNVLGPILFAVCLFFAIALCHLITLPFVLKYYRAKWLSSFAED